MQARKVREFVLASEIYPRILWAIVVGLQPQFLFPPSSSPCMAEPLFAHSFVLAVVGTVAPDKLIAVRAVLPPGHSSAASLRAALALADFPLEQQEAIIVRLTGIADGADPPADADTDGRDGGNVRDCAAPAPAPPSALTDPVDDASSIPALKAAVSSRGCDMFRCLAIFPSSFTLPAAAAVAGIPDEDVALALIHELSSACRLANVTESRWRVWGDPHPGSIPLACLLSFAKHFVAVSNAADALYLSVDFQKGLAMYDDDKENLAVLYAHCANAAALPAELHPLLLQLGGLEVFFLRKQLETEQAAVLQGLVSIARLTPDPIALPRFLLHLASVRRACSLFTDAEALCREALQYATTAGPQDAATVATCNLALGRTLCEAGNLSAAVSPLNTGKALLQERGTALEVAARGKALGYFNYCAKRLETAEKAYLVAYKKIRAALGAKHPLVAECMVEVAGVCVSLCVCVSLNRLVTAISPYVMCTSVCVWLCEAVCGCRYFLSVCVPDVFAAQGKHSDACGMATDALFIRRAALCEHALVAQSLHKV